MCTKKFILFAFIVSDLFALQQVTCAPLYTASISNDLFEYPVVYRRFIRRRPPMHLHDKYTDEIIEIFHTKEKPPAFGARMSDEDVDKFIFCDFNRHLDECKKYWDSRKRTRPTLTTPTSKASTTAQPTTTTVVQPTTTNVASKSEPTTSTSNPLEITSTTVLLTTESTTEIAKIPPLEENYYDYDVERYIENVDEEEENEQEGENQEEQKEDNDYYAEIDF